MAIVSYTTFFGPVSYVLIFTPQLSYSRGAVQIDQRFGNGYGDKIFGYSPINDKKKRFTEAIGMIMQKGVAKDKIRSILSGGIKEGMVMEGIMDVLDGKESLDCIEQTELF